MMIDLFSSSIRGTANIPAGEPQAASGVGIFGSILATLTGAETTAGSTVEGDETPASATTQEADAKANETEDMAEQPEPQESHIETEHAAETVHEDAKPALAAQVGTAHVPTNQGPVSDNASQEPLHTPLSAVADGDAPEPRQFQTGAVGPSQTSSNAEGRDRTKAATDPASPPTPPPGSGGEFRAGKMVHSQPVAGEARAKSAVPQTPGTPAATVPAQEQFQPAPAPAITTSNAGIGRDQSMTAGPVPRDGRAVSEAQTPAPNARGASGQKEASAGPERPAPLATGWPISDKTPASTSVTPSPSGNLFLDPRPAPPFLQQQTGYAAGTTTPTAIPGIPASGLQPTAGLLPQGTENAVNTTTTALPVTGKIPQPPPVAPARSGPTSIRWVEPVTEPARWATPPPGTGPVTQQPQTPPFAGATPIAGLPGAHELPGNRLTRGEERTMRQTSDGQHAMNPASATFATQAEQGITTPRPAAEIARDTAQQIGAQVLNLGKGRFELSLSPSELGKVDMLLQDNDNRLTLVVNAERPETMDLIRRHIGLLELELRQLGLGNLSLQLGTGGAPGSQGGQGQESLASAAGNDTPTEPARPAANPAAAGDHLDLRL